MRDSRQSHHHCCAYSRILVTTLPGPVSPHPQIICLSLHWLPLLDSSLTPSSRRRKRLVPQLPISSAPARRA
jgi:hypothetical protein